MVRRLSCYIAILWLACCWASSSVWAGTQPISKYFHSSDGVRLHYLEAGPKAGHGVTIVFVPGWTMPAEIWEPQLRHFAKSFHVIAFDPRGQGESQVAREGYVAERRARDIAELIDRVGEPVVLVGWSLGVLESLTYIDIAGTERLRALVLVDNSIGEEPPPSSDPTFFKRLRAKRSATMERFVRSMYRTPQPEPYIRKIVTVSQRMPLDASIALLSYPFPREHWKEVVYRTKRPVLYAVTKRFEGQAENLKKNRPATWIHVFENAGHALFIDESNRFNRLLEDFLSKEVLTHEKNPKQESKE